PPSGRPSAPAINRIIDRRTDRENPGLAPDQPIPDLSYPERMLPRIVQRVRDPPPGRATPASPRIDPRPALPERFGELPDPQPGLRVRRPETLAPAGRRGIPSWRRI